MNKKIVLAMLLIGLFVGSASALVFYDQQGTPREVCGLTIFECITSEKLDTTKNENPILMQHVLNKLNENGQIKNVYWRN